MVINDDVTWTFFRLIFGLTERKLIIIVRTYLQLGKFELAFSSKWVISITMRNNYFVKMGGSIDVGSRIMRIQSFIKMSFPWNLIFQFHKMVCLWWVLVNRLQRVNHTENGSPFNFWQSYLLKRHYIWRKMPMLTLANTKHATRNKTDGRKWRNQQAPKDVNP